MILRALHRSSACIIGVFVVVHIANHLVSIAGVSCHIAFMEAARMVYRQVAIEPVLLFCVAFQVASGLWLVGKRWKQRTGGVAWLQALSGVYLAFFLLVHIGAVMYGRSVLRLDTNFYYAAAGLHMPPYHLFFAPYYFLAVVALFAHAGCAAYWHVNPDGRVKRRLALAVPMVAGTGISLLITLSLAGFLEPVNIPAEYKATYVRPPGSSHP